MAEDAPLCCLICLRNSKKRVECKKEHFYRSFTEKNTVKLVQNHSVSEIDTNYPAKYFLKKKQKNTMLQNVSVSLTGNDVCKMLFLHIYERVHFMSTYFLTA